MHYDPMPEMFKQWEKLCEKKSSAVFFLNQSRVKVGDERNMDVAKSFFVTIYLYTNMTSQVDKKAHGP